MIHTPNKPLAESTPRALSALLMFTALCTRHTHSFWGVFIPRTDRCPMFLPINFLFWGETWGSGGGEYPADRPVMKNKIHPSIQPGPPQGLITSHSSQVQGQISQKEAKKLATLSKCKRGKSFPAPRNAFRLLSSELIPQATASLECS